MRAGVQREICIDFSSSNLPLSLSINAKSFPYLFAQGGSHLTFKLFDVGINFLVDIP